MNVTIDAKAPPAAPAPDRDLQSAPLPGSAGQDRPPSRHAGADALRAVAAMAVICVHTTHWAQQNTGADRAVWYSTTLLVRFCVPAFVLLTGLVLAYRYGEQRLGGAFLLRRARRSLVPWLVWAPTFLLFDLFLTGELARTPGAVSDWWSLGGGHLYYLILVPQLYVLMIVWPRHRRTAASLAVALLAVQVGLDTFRLYAPLGGNLWHQAVLNHGFEQFPYWIGYFAVGVAAGRFLAARRSLPGRPFAIAVPLTALLLLWVDRAGMASPRYAEGTGSFLRPLMVPYVLAVCGAVLFGLPAVLRRLPRLDRTTALVSRHSLGIYVVHPMLLAGFGRTLGFALHSHLPWSILGVLALTVLTAVSALLVSMLLARTPLAVTIGETWKRRGRRDTPHEPERELRGAPQRRGGVAGRA